jgi:phosphoribosyl-AMP cyclohydrolase
MSDVQIENLKFTDGLLPVIIQDAKSQQVYMLGYANPESLSKTLESGYVWFWSRSREKLWLKGETSGNKLKVVSLLTDCDRDTLLIQVKLEGTCVCHTGNLSCFISKLTKS